jgi:thiamine biosynthesis protein ThiS
VTADSTASLEIVVNGEAREVPADSTVADLLEALQIPRELVAVERNRKVVRRAAHSETRLEAGDRLEIVRFVGGG